MREGFIDFGQLERGMVYRLVSRNLSCGVFDGDGFIGIREKFGARFLDKEYTRSRNSGTASAKLVLGVIGPEVDLRMNLRSECESCSRPVNFDMARAERWMHNDGSVMCPEVAAIAVSNVALVAALEKFDLAEKGARGR